MKGTITSGNNLQASLSSDGGSAGIETVAYLPETRQYQKRVYDAEGTIVDTHLVDKEIKYAQDNNYYQYIAYWTDKRFGKYEGTEPSGKVPIVSFSFDDCRFYNYTTWELMAAKGSGRGTFFMNSKFIGEVYDPAYLDWDEVSEMYAGGCDFQCHAWSHADRYREPPPGGLPFLTPGEILLEMTNQNDEFAAHNLPYPWHHAYPNYITNFDVVLPIVAQYRKTMRGTSVFIASEDYHGLNWWEFAGFNTAYDNYGVIKAEIDKAIATNTPLHIAGHSITDSGVFNQVLDYLYAAGITPMTLSEYYAAINAYRDKLFNVTERDYEILFCFDAAHKIGTYQGQIIFDGTLAQVSVAVADKFKDVGCMVGFWDDTTDAAFAYAVPNNTKYYDGQNVTVDPVTDQIGLVGHGFLKNMELYLTGTTPPGGLSFDTKYYVKGAGSDAIKLAAIFNGATINITTAGSGVKLSTYGFRDELVAASTTPINCLETMHYRIRPLTDDVTFLNLAYKGFGGNLSDCGLHWFKNFGISEDYITMRYNFLGGNIPEEILNLYHLRWIDLRNNQLTGGMDNFFALTKVTERILLSNNLINEVIPANLGNMIYVDQIHLDNNQITGYETGAISIGMTDLDIVNINGNAITAAADINQILIDLLACVVVSGLVGTCNLSGGTNATPTGAGATAKADLITAGWAVTTN